MLLLSGLRRLMKSLGQAGEIEPETEGILTEYDVDFSEFSEEVVGCLPQDLPWSIPAPELSRRRDLRYIEMYHVCKKICVPVVCLGMHYFCHYSFQKRMHFYD